MKADGYYTVEATFIITICVWVMVSLCYGGLYIHDRIAMETVTNELAGRDFSDGKKVEVNEWKKNAEKKLEKCLYLLQVKAVSADRGITAVKIKVRYRLPISFDYLKKILSGGKAEPVFETAREIVQPAKSKWDYDLFLK